MPELKHPHTAAASHRRLLDMGGAPLYGTLWLALETGAAEGSIPSAPPAGLPVHPDHWTLVLGYLVDEGLAVAGDGCAVPVASVTRPKAKRGKRPGPDGDDPSQRWARSLLEWRIAVEPAGRLAKLASADRNETVRKWANDFRLLFERDKVTPEDARRVGVWLKGETEKAAFWRGVIQSASSFRRHFDKMLAAMRAERESDDARRRHRERERPAPKPAPYHKPLELGG